MVKRSDVDPIAPPDSSTIEKLNERATQKLAEIVQRFTAGEALWQGYREDEVAAARALLDVTATKLER